MCTLTRLRLTLIFVNVRHIGIDDIYLLNSNNFRIFLKILFKRSLSQKESSYCIIIVTEYNLLKFHRLIDSFK